MTKAYHSFVHQSLHYFSRPHQSILRDQLVAPSAWKREQITQNPDLIYTFSAVDIEEANTSIRHFQKTGKPLHQMTPDEFPLSELSSRVSRWRNVLNQGCGVQIIKGVPVNEWKTIESEIFFWGLGLYLGIPGAQDKDGQLLGHVKNTTISKEEEKQVRLYKTSSRLGYHCDAADVVGLLCLKKAKTGGTSHLVSSVSI